MSKQVIRVLFCGSDSGLGAAIERTLGAGFELQRSEHSALPQPSELAGSCDVILLELSPGVSGADMAAALHFLEEMAGQECAPPAIFIVAAEDRDLSRKLMEKGAHGILTSPLNMLEVRLLLRRAERFHQAEREAFLLRGQQNAPNRLHELVGTSELMQEVFALAQKIAPCDVTVLITGETGTGKELLARAIHRMSSRSSGPFVAFSCANLPETLVEDELFGHEKGAFTGAVALRQGRLEMADRGTLFLDEVGDLSAGLQPKLLRVLQERTFERLGSNNSQTVNIRLVCATNRDLSEMVKEGKFREDLYYRLNVVQLRLPSLRERRDDLPVLAQHFLERFAQQFGKKAQRFSLAALQALEEHTWPGNVRELENVIQRAVVLGEGSTIELRNLPASFNNGFKAGTSLARSYEEQVRDFKRRLILRALNQHGWQKTMTARELGMARNYLHRLINQLRIRPEAGEQEPNLPGPGVPPDRLM